MTVCIVPLAGPDFVKGNVIKALQVFRNEYSLKYILQSRPWSDDIDHYIFIFLNNCQQKKFAKDYLQEWFSDRKLSFVFLSDVTQGAAWSVLAGLTQIRDINSTIIVDLADIYYQIPNYSRNLITPPLNGSIVFLFKSDLQCYSYVELDDSSLFIRSREKEVISNNASSGTYIFDSSIIFMQAFSSTLKNSVSLSYEGLDYVCPVLNGVKSIGGQVIPVSVSNVKDLKFLQ